MMENIPHYSSWTLFTICLGMGISIMYQLRCNLNAWTVRWECVWKHNWRLTLATFQLPPEVTHKQTSSIFQFHFYGLLVFPHIVVIPMGTIYLLDAGEGSTSAADYPAVSAGACHQPMVKIDAPTVFLDPQVSGHSEVHPLTLGVSVKTRPWVTQWDPRDLLNNMTFVHELPKKVKFLVRNNPYSQQNGQCTFDMGLVDGYNEVATVYYNYQLVSLKICSNPSVGKIIFTEAIVALFIRIFWQSPGSKDSWKTNGKVRPWNKSCYKSY